MTVLFFGGLKEALGSGREEVQLDAAPGRAFELLFGELCARHSKLPALMGSVRLAVNEEFCPGIGLSAVAAGPALTDGDVVAFIPPVTGG